MTISTSTRWTRLLHHHKRTSRCLNRLIQTPMVAGWSLHPHAATNCPEGHQEVSHRGKSVPQIRPLATVMQGRTTIIALSTLPAHWITSRKYCLTRCKPQPQWVQAKEPQAPRRAPINPQLNQRLRRPHSLSTNSTWGRRIKIIRIRTLNCLLTFTTSNGTVLRTSSNSHQRRKSRTDSKNSTLPLSRTTLTQTSLIRFERPQNPLRSSERLSWRRARG
jgi:hypothetical protein